MEHRRLDCRVQPARRGGLRGGLRGGVDHDCFDGRRVRGHAHHRLPLPRRLSRAHRRPPPLALKRSTAGRWKVRNSLNGSRFISLGCQCTLPPKLRQRALGGSVPVAGLAGWGSRSNGRAQRRRRSAGGYWVLGPARRRPARWSCACSPPVGVRRVLLRWSVAAPTWAGSPPAFDRVGPAPADRPGRARG